MTDLDPDALRDALQRVGARITLPLDGPARVLERERAAIAAAAGGAPAVTSVSSVRRPSRRVLLVAAAVFVLALGTVGAFNWERTPTHQTFGAPPSVGRAPTTGSPGGLTVDSGSTSGFSSSDGNTAPTKTVTKSGTSSASLAARVESTGKISLTVARGQVAGTLVRLGALATRDGGFVATTHYTADRSNGLGDTGTITLQVPVARFAAVVSAVEAVGHPTAVSTTSTDVTGQYVDLTSQITALQASRTQYLAIMRRATTIAGILQVQSQLDTLQSQIQQLQGQLYVLTTETAYGTLAVSLAVVGAPAHPGRGHASGVLTAWRGAVGGFVTGFEDLIRVLGPALFAGLCLAALYLLARAARRAMRRRLI